MVRFSRMSQCIVQTIVNLQWNPTCANTVNKFGDIIGHLVNIHHHVILEIYLELELNTPRLQKSYANIVAVGEFL